MPSRWSERPGFTVPTLAHATGPIRSDVVEELQLYLHGLDFSDTPITLSALSADGRALVLWEDAHRTAAGLRPWSAKDAAAWPALQRAFGLVASPRVRNQATVGGVLADAAYASDPPAMFAALDARALRRSTRGEREVAID